MNTQKRWLYLSVVALALLAAVTVVAERDQKKAPPYPLSLFAQATPDDYLGEKDCAESGCHYPHADNFNRSPHAPFVRNPKAPIDQQGCEACHGPAKPHLEDPTKIFSYSQSKPADIAAMCLRCHADTMRLSQWHRTQHGKADVACTACHQIHWQEHKEPPARGLMNLGSLRSPQTEKEPQPRRLLKFDDPILCSQCHQRQANEFRLNFHHPVPERRLECSECHEAHPSKAAQKRFRPIKEMCVSCHPDKAGPFVYEHDPVAGWSGEGCTECHRAHGSPNPKLLNASSRGLCTQCHTDKSATHYPGRTCWMAGCHGAVHGSNSDAFLRRP
ncbi:MAG: cytochrome c3 family protein [Armatimonadota bacterium]